MDTKVYAKTVVDEALRVRPRAWLWEGQFSWVLWFLDTFFGCRIFVSKLFLMSVAGPLAH